MPPAHRRNARCSFFRSEVYGTATVRCNHERCSTLAGAAGGLAPPHKKYSDHSTTALVLLFDKTATHILCVQSRKRAPKCEEPGGTLFSSRSGDEPMLTTLIDRAS